MNKSKKLLTVPLSKKYNQGYLCRTNPRTHPSCYKGVAQTGECISERHTNTFTPSSLMVIAKTLNVRQLYIYFKMVCYSTFSVFYYSFSVCSFPTSTIMAPLHNISETCSVWLKFAVHFLSVQPTEKKLSSKYRRQNKDYGSIVYLKSLNYTTHICICTENW